jgi:hypothetical protein
LRTRRSAVARMKSRRAAGGGDGTPSPRKDGSVVRG